MTLGASSFQDEGDFATIRKMVADASNEYGATTVEAGSAGTQRCSGPMPPIFVRMLRAGLPPFSAFFMEILRHYQIHLLHLHPASVTILTTFTYLREAFLDVEPSVAFFRQFYSLRLNAADVTGCVSFRLEPLVLAILITMAVTKRLEDFRNDWVLVDVGRADEALLEFPAARPEKIQEAWSSRCLDGGAVTHPLKERIALLR